MYLGATAIDTFFANQANAPAAPAASSIGTGPTVQYVPPGSTPLTPQVQVFDTVPNPALIAPPPAVSSCVAPHCGPDPATATGYLDCPAPLIYFPPYIQQNGVPMGAGCMYPNTSPAAPAPTTPTTPALPPQIGPPAPPVTSGGTPPPPVPPTVYGPYTPGGPFQPVDQVPSGDSGPFSSPLVIGGLALLILLATRRQK